MTATALLPPLRLGFVSYGDSGDRMIASGIPYYLRQGMRELERSPLPPVEVKDISSRPSWAARLAMKALSFRRERAAWERQYLHGRSIARARSRRRDVGARRGEFDALLHVRTWYSPAPLPYASFIDATVNMVRGYDRTWDLTDRQFADEIAVEGEFYRRAAVVYCASHAVMEDLEANYGVSADAIVHVGAGTTLPGLAQLEKSVIEERAARPRVLFVGKDPERKGLFELIDALEIVREETPDLELSIVGPAAGLGAARKPWITEHGLVTDKSLLGDLYARASMFALPAHRESYGLVIPEALSYGLPCLVSRTGELPFLIEDGVQGAVVPRVASEDIAAGVRRILGNAEDFRAMSYAAHARGKTHDWTSIARLMVEDLSRRLS